MPLELQVVFKLGCRKLQCSLVLISSFSPSGSRIGIDLPQLVSRSKSDRDVCGGMFGLACYIEHSLPVLLFLAHKVCFSFVICSHQGDCLSLSCSITTIPNKRLLRTRISAVKIVIAVLL
jgi:hypothetical protein